MFKRLTIQLRSDEIPVTIEVDSGYVTLGSFILAYGKKGVNIYQEFGKDPKRIDDSIPDIFLIPIEPSELEDYRVAIIGKYGSAPGHNQIRVNYIISQGDDVLETIEIEKTSSEPYERFIHMLEFALT